MRRMRQSGWLATAAGAALLVTSGGASADPQEATHVDSLAAAAFGSTIAVSGQASFVDAPIQVGEDAIGDTELSSIGGDATPLGDDLTTATIARPDPFKNTLTFTLGIANQPPQLNGVPEAILYNWSIAVDGLPDRANGLSLQAIRTGQGEKPGASPVFRIMQCTENADGDVECDTLTQLSGKIVDGVVQWQVPMSQINANPGTIITQRGDVTSTLGASGRAWFWDFGGDAMFMDFDYTVPGPTVRLGIAPAGTPPELVELTGTATLSSDGSFTGTLPAPGEPGDYVVVAKACHGTASCGLAGTTITI